MLRPGRWTDLKNLDWVLMAHVSMSIPISQTPILYICTHPLYSYAVHTLTPLPPHTQTYSRLICGWLLWLSVKSKLWFLEFSSRSIWNNLRHSKLMELFFRVGNKSGYADLRRSNALRLGVLAAWFTVNIFLDYPVNFLIIVNCYIPKWLAKLVPNIWHNTYCSSPKSNHQLIHSCID